jgi:quercetin dioxygenase-like cupin family protein
MSESELVLGHFEDVRGTIDDILPGPIDVVTRIFTRAGHVRGNHVHEQTVQWTYVVSGRMMTVLQYPDERQMEIREPGALFCEPAGLPHAWQALEDTVVLVLTRGPRAGAAYESDTRRLDLPLIQPTT